MAGLREPNQRIRAGTQRGSLAVLHQTDGAPAEAAEEPVSVRGAFRISAGEVYDPVLRLPPELLPRLTGQGSCGEKELPGPRKQPQDQDRHAHDPAAHAAELHGDPKTGGPDPPLPAHPRNKDPQLNVAQARPRGEVHPELHANHGGLRAGNGQNSAGSTK